MACKKNCNCADKKEQHKELHDELKTLAKNVKENLILAWNSEQRKKAEKEVGKGFDMMVKGINLVIAEAKKGTLDEKIKAGVHKALKKTNAELEKGKKVWKPAKNGK